MSTPLGIIGFGEAGAAIGAGLAEAGADVHAFDVRAGETAMAELAAGASVHMVGSLEELAACCEVLICLTNARAAPVIAREVAPFLRTGQIYCDWNSASPQTKQRIGELVRATGARFVDGAVMAAVPPRRQAVPVLLSGDGADEFVIAVEGFGMNLEVLGAEPGQASAVKMFRSLLIKGLEALLIECLLGARRFGAGRRVLDSMDETFGVDDWADLASYLVGRSIAHGARRAVELEEVAQTLSHAGIDPLLASAGAERLSRFAEADLPRRSDDTVPTLGETMAWLLGSKEASDA